MPAEPRLRRRSLTLQILMGVAIPFLLVTALIGLIAYFSAQDEITEVYDSQLITSAQELWRLTRHNDDPDDLRIGDHDLGLDAEDQAALDEYASWRSFRVFKNDKVVIASDNAPLVTVPIGPKGLRDVTDAGGHWRVFTLIVPADHTVVEVREKLQARREVSGRIVWGVSLPLLLVTPIIALAVWFGIRWGLRDLRHFASAVRQRSFDDLSRIPEDTVPREMTPLSNALNHLLEKLERSLAQERLFTDNAAHELRTPLAALGVQVAVARNARSAKERNALLDDLVEGVSRTSRLLDQLLTLARIHHTSGDAQALNLYQAARDILGDAYPRARIRSVEIALSGAEDAVITARPALVRLLLGNLVDNAIKYSPIGGDVVITVERSGADTVVTVRDHGPGIAPEEREAVFGRFYRIKGTLESGSGLGLSIVRSICDMLDVAIRLYTPADGEGLGVELRFKS